MPDGFEKGGDDGDFFVFGDEVEEVGVDAVDAGELMGAFAAVELAVDVGDFSAIEGEVLGGAGGTDGEGGVVVGRHVAGDEFVDTDVGEDVAVIDEDGFVADPGGDVFNAAACF